MADNPLKTVQTDDEAGSANGDTEKAAKKAASYHVLEKIDVSELDENYTGVVYVDLGVFQGVNADKAVDSYLDSEPDVDAGTWVPVPTRHFKEQSIAQEPVPPKRVRQRA